MKTNAEHVISITKRLNKKEFNRLKDGSFNFDTVYIKYDKIRNMRLIIIEASKNILK